MPTAARARAAAANNPTSRSRKRRSASQPPISTAKVEILTGASGARSWKMPRAAETISPTGAALRIRMVGDELILNPRWVIDVNDRARREIQALRANIAGDANYCKRLQVAVHIAKIDHLTDGVLIGPALAS